MRFGRAHRPRRRKGYVTGYLLSIAWFRRRDQWFAEEQHRKGAIRCEVCRKAGKQRTFELHHVDYDRVTQDAAQQWIAG